MADDQTQSEQEIDSEEFRAAIRVLLDNAPQPIQNFLRGNKLNALLLVLTQKYQLHVDQAGIFEREFLMMLLGATTPAEFTSTLQQAGIAPEAVQGLTRDINEQVFIPLRKEEERMLPAVQQPSRPVAAPVPPMRVEMKVPPAPPMPRPTPPPPANLPGTGAPIPPAVPNTIPRPTPPPPSAAPVPPAPATPIKKEYGADPYREPVA